MGMVGEREQKDNVPVKCWQFSLFLPIVAKMTDGDVYEMYKSKQICLDNPVKNALFPNEHYEAISKVQNT